MIKEGQHKKARYWGKFRVSKVAQLKRPVDWYSQEIGTALFTPTLVKIDWETPPSGDRHEFWFPYWMTIGGRERYGQFAPMIGEKALLELLQSAIGQEFFSRVFLQGLEATTTQKLESE